MRIRYMLVACSSLALTGCLGIHGMDPILDQGGYPTASIERTLFSQDFAKAYCARSGGVTGRGQACGGSTSAALGTPTPAPVSSPTPTKPADDAHVRPMLRSGMMYVRTYCNSYFRTMAVEQRKGAILRDTLAPLTAIITGLAGIRSLSLGSDVPEEDVLTAVALISTASAATLDIYDEHLLFGADNIDSVRTLTMKSLETHKLAVLKQSGYSFEDAIETLIEHQNICAPQSILAATRKAIKAGTPVTDQVVPTGAAAVATPSPTPSPTPTPTATPSAPATPSVPFLDIT